MNFYEPSNLTNDAQMCPDASGKIYFPLEKGVSPECRDVCDRGCENANTPLAPLKRGISKSPSIS